MNKVSIALATTLGLSGAFVAMPKELSDVQPTDWAYGALKSLVERYSVISGYPSEQFKGNKPITRYEIQKSITLRG